MRSPIIEEEVAKHLNEDALFRASWGPCLAMMNRAFHGPHPTRCQNQVHRLPGIDVKPRRPFFENANPIEAYARRTSSKQDRGSAMEILRAMREPMQAPVSVLGKNHRWPNQ